MLNPSDIDLLDSLLRQRDYDIPGDNEEAFVDAVREYLDINEVQTTEERDDWPGERLLIATIQSIAASLELYPEDRIDGLMGPTTRHAIDVMWFRLVNSGSVAEPAEEVSLANPETRRDVQEVRDRQREPASIRYYNPGAMYPGPSSRKFGAKHHEIIGGGHLIAVFPNDRAGAAAMFDLLDNKYTGLSVRAAIAKWSGENSAVTYAQRVNRETGVDSETILTHEMIRDPAFAIPLARAMAHVEAGKPYPMDDHEWADAHSFAFQQTPITKIGNDAQKIEDWAPNLPWSIPATDKPKDAVLEQRPVWPRQRDVPEFYGERGANQVKLQLPFPMKLAWQPATIINAISVHKKVHDSAARAFTKILTHYGESEISKLHLDLFGGSLNVRRIRGGSGWSMHSWGIAIDFDPDRNQLNWNHTRAAFARSEYKEFFNIWEAEGWVSLGRTRDYDWMHIQAARL